MANLLKITSKGSGIPLVFIHGWGLNSGVWQPTIEQLQAHYQVITVDLPGFGLNVDYQVKPYTLANVTEVIQQTVMKALTKATEQAPVYIGWSLGGLVASEIALTFPDSVKALVTVASSPCFVEQENWPGIKSDVLALFHQQLTQDTEKTINNFLKIQAMGSPHLRQDIKKLRELVMQYPIPSQQTLEHSLEFLEVIDQRKQLTKVSQPFLRLYGKQDGLVPKSAINLIDKLVKDSDVIIFEQSSHAPFISEFELFINTLKGWLQHTLVE